MLGDLTPCLTILETLKVSVMTAFSFKEEFSVLKCLKTIKIKIIFLSPDSFTFHWCWSARYKKFYNFSILFYSCLKMHLMAFPFETHTAISAFRAILINYIYSPYLFRSNTMQRVSPIINSQRQPNLEKSEYTDSTFALQSVSWSLAEFRHNKIVQSPHENYFNVCRQHKEK